jgi:hypothetical protein
VCGEFNLKIGDYVEIDFSENCHFSSLHPLYIARVIKVSTTNIFNKPILIARDIDDHIQEWGFSAADAQKMIRLLDQNEVTLLLLSSIGSTR